MTTQSENQLEENFVQQLIQNGYQYVKITEGSNDLILNLKKQLEIHNQPILKHYNKTKFSEQEFQRILTQISKGTECDKARTLRDKVQVRLDDDSVIHISLFNSNRWCENEFQVTQQVKQSGNYNNQYDVTILINGLPLVHIELKRRGNDIKEAFNQINRYRHQSFNANHGLYHFVQVFVISNGVNTRYYANNKKQSFDFAFYWTDENNKRINHLTDFTDTFLKPCFIAKVIAKYVVINTANVMLLLRPYQIHAVEAITQHIKTSTKNGYIWHTTGSGKTLTSFKASQVITAMPEVHKVVFVVDRKDLDNQTKKEFNQFKKDSVADTEDTRKVVEQLKDDTKLIVTTIQKLNNAIKKNRYKEELQHLVDKKIVFIFDECHRSQFGETHKAIKTFFTNHQMIGFTGTPIFVENAPSKGGVLQITEAVFDQPLHTYVITDALADGNVLPFIESFVGRYQRTSTAEEIDIEVEAINEKEVLESDARANLIVDYIIEKHAGYTHNKRFNAMFCVSSVEMAIKYYQLFKQKKDVGKHTLKVATIFSYTANEEDPDANDDYIQYDNLLDSDAPVNKYTREHLDDCISEYNQMFNTNWSTKDSKSFYGYHGDIATKVKNKELDILIVVGMFLTGFDSPSLNTLYVDKNLKYHGLLQAYSRTNRLLNDFKSHGNIVCFRNLKQAADDALRLFASTDTEAKSKVFLLPYTDYVAQFQTILEAFYQLAPHANDISHLQSDEDKAKFIQLFNQLLICRNRLQTFADFNYADLNITEQTFNDYSSQYQDLRDSIKRIIKERASILNDVTFEMTLIESVHINFDYIIKQIAHLNHAKDEGDLQEKSKAIISMMKSTPELRQKSQLISEFIQKQSFKGLTEIQIEDTIQALIHHSKTQTLTTLSQEHDVDLDKLIAVIDEKIARNTTVKNADFDDIHNGKVPLLQRNKKNQLIAEAVQNFLETYY